MACMFVHAGPRQCKCRKAFLLHIVILYINTTMIIPMDSNLYMWCFGTFQSVILAGPSTLDMVHPDTLSYTPTVQVYIYIYVFMWIYYIYIFEYIHVTYYTSIYPIHRYTVYALPQKCGVFVSEKQTHPLSVNPSAGWTATTLWWSWTCGGRSRGDVLGGKLRAPKNLTWHFW